MSFDSILPEPLFIQKGQLIGGGVTGIVELLPNGYAVKTPWPGEEGRESRQEIRTEVQVYNRLSSQLGACNRFIKMIAFGQDQLTITMEYMVNGTLREYLRSSNREISRQQRHSWIQAMAEGLELLHSLSILHCDLTPHNILLDDKLELKIGDFGCSSIDDSASRAAASARFYPPRSSWRSPITPSGDLFALGSCMYEILTGAASFEEMPSPQVRTLMRL